MNVQRWIARREPSWRQLDALLQQAEKKGLKSLTSDQVRQLASLYRSGRQLTLPGPKNQPIWQFSRQRPAAAHQPSLQPDLPGLSSTRVECPVGFYTANGFPATVRQSMGYIALAYGAFFAGFPDGMVVFMARPQLHEPDFGAGLYRRSENFPGTLDCLLFWAWNPLPPAPSWSTT